MLKSMRKSKNRYFYHIFVSPGDAPGAVTLNVVWMERERDAYKLLSLHVPIYLLPFLRYSEIFVKKSPFYHTPLAFYAPVREVPVRISEYRHLFGTEKLEWCRYPMVKNFEDIFIRFDVIHERDRRTDGQTDTA